MFWFAVVGAQSRGVFPVAANGGETFAIVSEYYFGKPGSDYISADFCGGMFENSDRPCYKLWGDVLKRYFRTDLLIVCGQ